MIELYHFTCAHRAPRIVKEGELVPHFQPLLGVELVWLTDLAEPDRDGLGLTSTTLACDRTEFRFRATNHVGVRPWYSSMWRAGLDRQWLDDLERFGAPLHWFVSEIAVPVVSSSPGATSPSPPEDRHDG